jgi:hypothetical protein
VVGHVLKISGGMRSKWGLVLGAANGVATIQTKVDEAVELDETAAATLERRAFAGSDLPSAAGRLMAAHLAGEHGDLKGKWDPAQAAAAAWTAGIGTVAQRRAAVLDWLQLGLTDHVDGAGLGPTELAWYRAVSSARSGDISSLVDQLVLLPPLGYRSRIALIQRHVLSISGYASWAGPVASSISGLIEDDPHARSLSVVLLGGSMAQRVVAIQTLASRLNVIHPDLGTKAVAMGESVAKGVLSDPGVLPLPMCRAVALWSSGGQGADLDGEAERLAPLPLSMIDDLIDNGAVTAASVGSDLYARTDGSYLRARVAPGALTIDDTYELQFLPEYARRLYALGDLERLTQFPAGEECAEHYMALLRLRNNPTTRVIDGLRPKAVAVLEQVDAHLEGLKDGGPALPAQTILADTTLWRLLRASALKGEIELSDDDRRAAPLFAGWRDLVEMQRLCFAGEWNQVEALGLQLKDQLTDESLSDEALNMTAYAQAVLGRPDDALSLLEQALAGSYTDALVVNASIVASELGSERAATFLARIFDEAPDRSIGVEALLKGVRLWLNDDAADTLPAPIVQSVREALQEPLANEALQLLLQITSNHDRAWLVNANVATTSDEQREMVNVWQTWAAAKTDGTNVTLREVALAIVPLNQRSPVAPWAERELRGLIDLVNDAVHVDFGEAAWVAGAVKVLAESRLLSLAEETIFMCQAGAHVAVALQESGEEIADRAEIEYIFTPAERWHAEKGDLPPGLISAVDDEVGSCIGVAALAMVIVTRRNQQQFANAWDALVARENWDYQNRPAILRQEAQILSEFEAYVERCRKYMQRLNRFPISERTQELRQSLASDVDDYGRFVARLRGTL